MQINTIDTKEAPMAVGPYSQGVTAWRFVFTAGEIPVDPADGSVPETFDGQVRKAFANVNAVLSAGGVRPSCIVNVTVYLTDIADFPTMNLIYKDYFSEPYPARTCVQVAALPKGVKIMVSAVGYKDAE